MYEQAIYKKAHILVFETLAGTLVFATDRIEEVATQEWFQEFLNIATRVQKKDVRQQMPQTSQVLPQQMPQTVPQMQMPQMSMPVQQQVMPVQQQAPQQMPVQQQMPQQPQQVAVPQPVQKTFLDVNPFEMDAKMWVTLNPQQQEAWSKRWYQEIQKMQAHK